MWQRRPPPPRLIDAAGRPQYGWWQDEPADYALQDLRLARPMGGHWPNFLRPLRFKHWHFISLAHRQAIIAMALVDLGYAHHVFVYVHDRQRGQTQALTRRTLPWSRRLRLARQAQGVSRYGGRAEFIELDTTMPPWQLHLDWPQLQLHAQLQLTAVEPLVLCLPAGVTGWTYTVKRAAMQVAGELTWRGQRLDSDGLLASHDLSLGVMRRQTQWQWCSLATWSGGHRFGLNLALGVNESGQNENAAWIDGRLHKLPAVWIAGQGEGCRVAGDGIDLRFQGQDRHEEFLHTGVIDSRFRQWQGEYAGEVVIAGQTWRLHNDPGLWEDHYVKW